MTGQQDSVFCSHIATKRLFTSSVMFYLEMFLSPDVHLNR